MKFRKHKTAAAAMALLVTAGCILPGKAAYAAYRYTPVQGSTASFDKYLVMDQEAQIPHVSFTYSITPGKAQTWDTENGLFEIYAGVGTPTMAGVGTDTANTIAFAPGDGSDSDAAHSEADLVKNLDTSVSKYAKKTGVIDFSGCTYTEPGVYRYIITESGTNQGVTNDADLTRVLDVYVTDRDGQLKAEAYVLHANESDVLMGEEHGTEDLEEAEMKPQGFTNVYETSNLTIRKEVAGNQASHDKYFEFTLEIRDAQPGTLLSVELSGADSVSEKNNATIQANQGKSNPSSLTVGEDGTLQQKFYLQHGQQITVQGLAKDTAYSVTENPEDYRSVASSAAKPVVAAAVGSKAADTEGVVEETDLTTGYLNERKGIIPTGVVMTVTPFAAVTLFGGLGAASIVLKKKKEKN